MTIYNTLSGQKEDLEKIFGGGQKKIRLFVCGPTVYDYSHIGHARTYIAFDVIARWLRAKSYRLFYLQNITDIDDKIIDRAKKENRSPKELARQITKAYLADMKALGIASVDKYAPASDYIKEIQRQIQALMDKGYAYQTSSGVYFEVKKFADYGRLSKQNLDALRPGWRIEPDPGKKDPLDFALWKNKKHDNEPSWPSPWGEGRPGWHIEDTAITEKEFGPQYELHGGAIDLKFPHHESEIAQQESISGKKPMVKVWLHTGFLLVSGEKMSKSLGNFITIKDFLKKYPANVLRYIVLSNHYRSPIDYTEQSAMDAQKALRGIVEFLGKLSLRGVPYLRASEGMTKQSNFEIAATPSGSRNDRKGADYSHLFEQAMNDDFNTPKALAVIFELINEINPKIWNLDKKAAKATTNWIKNKLGLLGIDLKLPKIPLKIRLLARKRELFRDNKQFIQADALRKQIESLGYILEDTPAGALVLKK